MTTPRFRVCLAEVLRWEGGWSNDPFDTGGPTNRGITIGVYAAYVGALGVVLTTDTRGRVTVLDEWGYKQLVEELRRIPADVVAEIYHRQYWRPICGDDLPIGIDLAAFDFAVNSGPTRAVKHLQKVLGVTIDGHIGAATLAAARAADPAVVVAQFLDSRRSFLRQIDVFWRFGRGWLRRVDGVQGAAMASLASAPSDAHFASGARGPSGADRGPVIAGARADQHPAGRPPPVPQWTTTVAAAPLPDPDAQSATQGRAVVTEAATMTGSSTGRAAEAAGGLGSAQLGVEVASAATRARAPGGSFDVLGFALALAQSPSFWIAAGVVGSAAYIWLERQRKARVL